jgi:DedD protein
MEQQVKARLIGATVLVVLAVVLVPELLSGPRHSSSPADATEEKRDTRRVVIDLASAVEAGSRVQPVATTAETKPREPVPLPTVQVPGEAAEKGEADEAAPKSVPESAPAATSPSKPATTKPASNTMPAKVASSGAPAATTAAATPRPATSTAKPSAEPSRPATKAAGGGWTVQVGAFGSAETARKLVADLKRDGQSAYIAPLRRDGKTLHRVRVGPVPTRADADKLATRLKGKGLPASVVAPD